MAGIDAVLNFFRSPVFFFAVRLIVLFLIALYLALVYWTYRDAKKRGALAFYWALIVLVSSFFGWIIYLIVRPPEFLEDAHERELEIKEKETVLGAENFCGGCGKPVKDDYMICPYCLRDLKRACIQCGKPLKLTWRACPYCKAEAS